MSGLDLDAIEARANAATPGPWSMLPGSALVIEGTGHDGEAVAECEKPDALKVESVPEEIRLMRARWQPNATFIAAARADVPALVARVRHLEALLAPVQEAARAMREAAKTYSPGEGGHDDPERDLLAAALATIEETTDVP